MSEERLNEIKDSIDFQLRVCEINNYETDMIIEEKELYNEVLSNKMLIQELRDTIDNQKEEIDRLNNIIETYKNANEYHQNKIEELEKLLRKTPSQLISENANLRAKNNRLNNIINELESYLEQQWLEWQDASDLWIKAQVQEDRIVLDKLKELKEE